MIPFFFWKLERMVPFFFKKVNGMVPSFAVIFFGHLMPFAVIFFGHLGGLLGGLQKGAFPPVSIISVFITLIERFGEKLQNRAQKRHQKRRKKVTADLCLRHFFVTRDHGSLAENSHVVKNF